MVFIIFSNIYNIWQIFFYFFLWEINLSVGQSDCLSVRERQSDMLDSHLAKPASERVNQLNRHCDEESFVCPSVRQSVSQLVRESVSQSVSQPDSQTFKQLVSQSASQPDSQTVSQSDSQTVRQSDIRSVGRSVSRLVRWLVGLSVSQSVHQPVRFHSVDRSVGWSRGQ